MTLCHETYFFRKWLPGGTTTPPGVVIGNTFKEGMTMAEKSSRTAEYCRNWSFIVYPDSAPEYWRDVLDEYHVPWACSPLHDGDKNPDGEQKKPHWHCVMVFEGKKCYQQVLELIKPLNCTIPQKVQSMKGMLRYFCHLDNPEKEQYNLSDIEYHGGFDGGAYLSPSSSQRYNMIRDMMVFIKERNYIDFLDFACYCAEERFDDWYPLLCDNSAFLIDKCITSNYKKYKRVFSEGSNFND